MNKVERRNLVETVKELKTLVDLRNLQFDLTYIRLCEENYDANWLDVRVCEAVTEEDGSAIYDIRHDLLRILGSR